MPLGTVVEYHREYYSLVLDGSSEEVVAKPRSRLEFVQVRAERDHQRDNIPVFSQQLAVGDRVDAFEAEPGHFVIERIHERQTFLMRRGTKRYIRRLQLVVANADQLAVVVSPVPELNINVIDRYFLAAIQGGLEPVLLVNKIDLKPGAADSVEIRNYSELGYRVIPTSATTGEGIDELSSALDGKFTVFCGQSGVGKSTILARITGEEFDIGATNPKTGRGRQTTVTSRMYHLTNGTQLVDTPGVRVFGLAHLTWLDVHEYFAKIAALAMQCSFRDCLHDGEPNCAVAKAIADGELAPERLASYVKLRQEADERHWESDRE